MAATTAGSTEKGRRRRPAFRRALRACAVGALALGVLFYRFLFLGNFAVVEPGRVYRSAQPKGEMDWVRAYGLASILNLRGGSPADAWYAAEVRTCEREGIDFYDLPMVATRRPSRAELLTLLDLLGRCRYPLLIHCKSGSDRTGLVSALYRLNNLAEPPDRAISAFSLWRGHVPAFGAELVQAPIKEYAAWLKSRRLAHSPGRFRQWVEHDYHAADLPTDPETPLQPGPRPQILQATAARR